jgi:hypothetical protein
MRDLFHLILLRFTYFVACEYFNPFYYQLVFHSVDSDNLFIHGLMVFGLFPAWDIMSNASKNTHVRAFYGHGFHYSWVNNKLSG